MGSRAAWAETCAASRSIRSDEIGSWPASWKRRRHRVRARHPPFALDRAPADHLRTPDADLSKALAGVQPQVALRDHIDFRFGARAGEEGRSGDRLGKISRTAAWDPL